jgi:hypothetical protein
MVSKAANIFTLQLDASIIAMLVQWIFMLAIADKEDHEIYCPGKKTFLRIVPLVEKKETCCLSMYVIGHVSSAEKTDDKLHKQVIY